MRPGLNVQGIGMCCGKVRRWKPFLRWSGANLIQGPARGDKTNVDDACSGERDAAMVVESKRLCGEEMLMRETSVGVSVNVNGSRLDKLPVSLGTDLPSQIFVRHNIHADLTSS